MHKTIPITAIPISLGEIFTLAEKVITDKTVNGAEVEKFENELSQYLNSGKVFSFDAGRTALYVGLQALHLNAGDEVIVPAYTCAIVFEMVLRLGLKPVFVDVDLQTYNIDSEKIPEAITPATKAIIPVHLFGRPCDMDSICEISDDYGLFIVEDVAQTLGAEFRGKKVGTFGDLAIFSFGPGKSMMGGEGGAMAVNNEELADRVCQFHSKLPSPDPQWILHVIMNMIAMRLFSDHRLYALVKDLVEKRSENTDKMILRNCLTLTGNNTDALDPTLKPAKMPNLSAAIVDKQLAKLDELNRKRMENAKKLTALLGEIKGNDVQLPLMNPEAKSTFTRYAVRVASRNRDQVIKEMLKKGVDAKELYHYISALLQKLSRRRYPHAEALSNTLMALPNHPLLADSDLQHIHEAFYSALQVT